MMGVLMVGGGCWEFAIVWKIHRCSVRRWRRTIVRMMGTARTRATRVTRLTVRRERRRRVVSSTRSVSDL